MVCCHVSGVPHAPVADPVPSGAIGFTVTSRTMVVVPARWKPKAAPLGTVPSVTPVMSTLPAPVTRLKLVFVFGLPVMFTVPFSDPLPPERATFVGFAPVAKLTVKEEPEASAKLWEFTFPFPAKERLPPPPTLTAPLALRLPLPPKETEPPLMATLPALMLAPAVVEMLLPTPTVTVWPVALSPPEPLKVIDPPLSVTAPPEFRSPPAVKVTVPPFTVSPPPGASVPAPARVSVAPAPTVTVPPVVNVFPPIRRSVPPVTSTAPLTSWPAPLRATPFSVRVPLPVFVRLAAVKGTEIATFPLGVTVIPPVTVMTRPPLRLMVAPEVMVSEFASPFPPLLMETVTAKGMVRSSAAVGTPAGFQLAAVFHEPLAALAHVRSTAWACAVISSTARNVTGIKRFTASPFSRPPSHGHASAGRRDGTRGGPARPPGWEAVEVRGTEHRGATSTTADRATERGAPRGGAPGTAPAGAPGTAGTRAPTRAGRRARTTPEARTPEAPPTAAHRASGARARPEPGPPRPDAGSPGGSRPR